MGSNSVSRNLCGIGTKDVEDNIVSFSWGLSKLENIVAETLLQTQMFPSLAARETYVADANFASWKQGNVSESSQKHFCFTDANFASETCVSQF